MQMLLASSQLVSIYNALVRKGQSIEQS